MRDASYWYPDGRVALKKVSWMVGRGEFAVVLGANGSGKTTFLMLLGGLLAPGEGDVLLDGRSVGQVPEGIRFRKVGFVFQNPTDQLLAPTIYDSVVLGALSLGLERDEAEERVKKALSAAGLWEMRNAAPQQLSFGQQKKAAIACALALAPEVLFLDEPASGLDPAAVTNLMRLLYDLNRKQGVTVVMTAGEAELIPLWTDRLIILEQGEVLSEGKPAAVFLDPALGCAGGLRLAGAAQLARLFEMAGDREKVFLPRPPMTVEEARQVLAGYRQHGGKLLRRGYTTGTCAAAAARAAMMALLGDSPHAVPVRLPDGRVVEIAVEGFERRDGRGIAWVVKDGGDDPDVTHGARIRAVVRFTAGDRGDVTVKGGQGVGTVTKPGLAVPPQQPAINPVPLRMIKENVAEVLPPGQGAEVTIEVPEGERLARQTMNPQLGIVGGISILGTTGIVEPMSEEAFKMALIPQLQIARASEHKTLVLTPGRRGVNIATKRFGIPEDAVVMVSNFFGFMLDECVKHGFQRVILWGHVGKLAKVAAGVFQTYNRIGDGRAEAVAALAAARGAPPDVVREILAAPVVEGMVAILRDAGLEEVWFDLAERASQKAHAYSRGLLEAGTVMFSYEGEVLGRDRNAELFLKEAQWGPIILPLAQ